MQWELLDYSVDIPIFKIVGGTENHVRFDFPVPTIYSIALC